MTYPHAGAPTYRVFSNLDAQPSLRGGANVPFFSADGGYRQMRTCGMSGHMYAVPLCTGLNPVRFLAEEYFAEMSGTIGGESKTTDFRNSRVVYASIMIVLLFTGFAGVVMYIHDITQHHVYFFPLFPLAFLLTLMAALPLIFYVSYSNELKHLHPLSPRDYVRFAKLTTQSINNNGNMKISAKDL